MSRSDKELALIKKVQKEFPHFVNGLGGLSVEELDRNVSIYANHREENLLARDADEELSRAKELKKELEAPYNDAEKALKLKLTYLHLLIKDKKEEL